MPLSDLKLTVVAHSGKALAGGASAVFEPPGGTIGHDAGNTLVLSDDEGNVARRHATIHAGALGWQLVNASEDVAIAVNGKMLAPGAQTELHGGELVNIGAYILQVAVSGSLPVWSSLLAPVGTLVTETPDNVAPAADTSNPLYKPALATGDPADPLAANGPSTTLDSLLDTALDPLALFGSSGPGWQGSSWDDAGRSESNKLGLFDDLVSLAPPDAFTAPCAVRTPGHAVRDDVPELGGHLRLKIAVPEPNQLDVPDRPDARDAGVSAREAPTTAVIAPATTPAIKYRSDRQQVHYGDAFGHVHEAPPCVVRLATQDYSGNPHMKTANAPLELNESVTPVKLPVGHEPFERALDGPQDAVSPANAAAEFDGALARAFLDGVGIASANVAKVGLTPELMYTLGRLVRTLRLPTQ